MIELLNNIKILINLDIKESKKYNNKQKNICYAFFMSLGIILISLLGGFIASVLLNLFGMDSFCGLISTIIFIVQVVLFFYALTNINKKIYQSKDNEILICLPISRKEIYIARIIEVYLQLLMMSVLVYLPVIITLGVCFSVNYIFYIFGVLCLPFISMIPCGIASLVALPVNKIINWFKFRFWLKLLFIVITLVLVFYLYNLAIFNIADALLLKNINSENIIYFLMKIFSNKLFPSTWISNVLLGEKIVIYLLLFVGLSLVTIVTGIIVNMFAYDNLFAKNIEVKLSAKTINTQTKKNSAFISYCLFEIKSLFRNSTYLFTYFGMALAMPIMVVFCNSFILEFASSKVGQTVNFGTTLFVVLIFVSIICSPSASFISKEGENFWIFKSSPNGIKIPLLAKSIVGISLIVLALVATFVLIASFKFVSIAMASLIVLIAIVYVIGLNFFGVLLNLIRPNLFRAGKENNSNVIIHMLVGFIISVSLGVTSIIMSFSRTQLMIAIIILGITTCFTIVNVIALLIFHKKLYLNMEVR